MEVVRQGVEHIVLRAHAQGMQPGAIRQFLLTRHDKDISAPAIDHYLKKAMEDPKIQAAMSLAKARPNDQQKSISDFEHEIEDKYKLLDMLMEEVKRRYVEGASLSPKHLRDWLLRRGVRPNGADWAEFMTIVEQQSLDSAIMRITSLQREMRQWLETWMRLRQIIPSGPSQSMQDVAQMTAQLMELCCDDCKLRIAGIRPKEKLPQMASDHPLQAPPLTLAPPPSEAPRES